MSDRTINDTHCKDNNSEKLIPLTIRLPKATYEVINELKDKHKTSFSKVVILAIEGKLEKYTNATRYVDTVQANKIENSVRELCKINRDILNNVRRIGINYNQEVKLKQAQKKYQDILADKYSGDIIRIKAYDELQAAKEEISKSYLDKEELNNLLTEFQKAAKKMEEISWHIHE